MLPAPERIALPPAPPSAPTYQPDAQVNEPLADRLPDGATAPTGDNLHSLHQSAWGDFLEPDRLGYAKNRDHVVGFEPHRFTHVPRISDAQEEAEWLVTRLELIGLLSHATPVAYVSRDLPKMDELKRAATRPLNAFEEAALVRLRRNEDVVINEQANRIRMVGSLRAGKQCLACHSVRRGELLGAFSYELLRRKPINRPPEHKRQVNRKLVASLRPECQ